MKIYNNEKVGNKRIVKILNIPIYVVNWDNNFREQHIMGNFIYTSKFDDYICNTEKNTKICGLNVFKRTEDGSLKKDYIFNFLYKTTDMKKEFYNKYKKFFDQDCDDIYILNSNSGETYLFLAFLASNFIKKNGSKKPLLVATKKYHIELIKMLHPDAKFVYVNKMQLFVSGDVFSVYKKRVFLLFSGEHFINVENSINNGEINSVHYFEMMLDRLHLTREDIEPKQIHLDNSVKHALMEKTKQMGLNTDKFVLLAPEALSCDDIRPEFWTKLCLEFQKCGYDVFMNITNEDTVIPNCTYKSCFLTFSEIYELAQMAKFIVSLRSGLTEILLQSKTPLVSLYTKFKNRHRYKEMPVERVLSGFGLEKLPRISDNFYEYNMSDIAQDDLIKEIKDLALRVN